MAAYLIVSAERGIGDQDRRVDRGVQLGDALGGSSVGAADHHTIRVQEVVDRGPLAQEFGVRHDEHVVTLQHPLDSERGSDGHGRLVDHDGARLQHRCDLGGGGLDVAQIRAAVVALRRRHAQEHDVGTVGGGFGAEDELEHARGAGVVHDRLEALLDDGDVPVVEQIDLALVDVSAHDVMAEVSETGARRQADVAGSDDTEANGSRHRVAAIGSRCRGRDSIASR